MGLDTASVMFLCAAKALGVNFANTVMIGRQSLPVDAEALRRVFSVLGVRLDAEDFLQQHRYGEPFFSLLGAKIVASLDCSAYENASIIHDMNRPVPGDLRERFSVVHDGGTIEHVFNIVQALKNCMEMVEIGGHFTQVNAANNFMGHGFWQFSPELIFRVFSPANGYQLEAVLLHEVVPGGAWYVVADPDEVRARVELCNRRPTYILTVAKRVARAEIFATPPQQSDYVARWERRAGRRSAPAPNTGEASFRPWALAGLTWCRRHLPTPVKRTLRVIARRLSFSEARQGFERAYYRRIDEEALLRGRLT